VKGKKKKSGKKRSRSWQLEGYDPFALEYYPLPGEYPSQEEAEKAARARLRDLEVLQPTQTSGGQAYWGIQDRVYVVRPDGTMYRLTTPVPLRLKNGEG
jgi:hypothetical protein